MLTMNHLNIFNMNLFEKIAEVSRPTESLKLYKFKPTPATTHSNDEMETVVAGSLGEAIRKNPVMLTWYLHSVTK